jgi:hypothetical protein
MADDVDMGGDTDDPRSPEREAAAAAPEPPGPSRKALGKRKRTGAGSREGSPWSPSTSRHSSPGGLPEGPQSKRHRKGKGKGKASVKAPRGTKRKIKSTRDKYDLSREYVMTNELKELKVSALLFIHSLNHS